MRIRFRGITGFLVGALAVGYFIPLSAGFGYFIRAERLHAARELDIFRTGLADSLARSVSDSLASFAPNAAEDAARIVFDDERVLSVVVHSSVYDMDFAKFSKLPLPPGAIPLGIRREIAASGDSLGYVEILIDESVFSAGQNRAYLKMLFLFGGMFFGALALVVPMLYLRVLRPLVRLGERAESLSSGDFTTSAEWPGEDELSEFGRALEKLRETLLASFTRINDLATKDELTGVSNRRAFMEAAERMLDLSRRYGKPLCLLILDIDFFKRINDTLGHSAGDAVLRDFADVVVGAVRRTDVFARVGGEEFALCMPETKLPEAILVAEKIRHTLEAHSFPFDLRITASLGLAELQAEQDLKDLYETADKALYKAKGLGRNRVEVA